MSNAHAFLKLWPLLLLGCGPSSLWVRPAAVGATVAPEDQEGETWDVTASEARTVGRVAFAFVEVPLLGFVANAALSRIPDPAAPDPYVEVYAGNELVCAGAVLDDSYEAGWHGAALRCHPFLLGDGIKWRVVLIDADLQCDDPIAECSGEGVPEMDDEGLVSSQSMTCRGPISRLAIKLQTVDAEDRPTNVHQPRLRPRQARGPFCPDEPREADPRGTPVVHL